MGILGKAAKAAVASWDGSEGATAFAYPQKRIYTPAVEKNKNKLFCQDRWHWKQEPWAQQKSGLSSADFESKLRNQKNDEAHQKKIDYHV